MSTRKAASTTAPKKIRLRSKPKKPKRQRLSNRITIDDGDTIARIEDQIREVYKIDVPADELVFRVERGYYPDDPDHFYAEWSFMEPEEDYQRRLKKYHERLRDWEKWFQENREAIEATLQARREEAKRRARERIEAERRRLEKHLASLEKKEKRLKK